MYIDPTEPLLNCPYCNVRAVIWPGCMSENEYYVQCDTTSDHLKLGPFNKLDIIPRNWNNVVMRINELRAQLAVSVQVRCICGGELDDSGQCEVVKPWI